MDNQPSVAPAPTDNTVSTSPSTGKISHAHRFIFGYIALLVLAAAIGGIYEWQHKKVKDLDTQVSSLQKQVSALQAEEKQVQSSTSNSSKYTISTITTGTYAGWSTITLTNEKLAFDYPSNWKFTNNNAQLATNDGSDNVTLKSPDGVEVIILTENDEYPSYDGPRTIVYAEPTTFLGQTAYIDYYADSTSASDPISGGSLAYSSTVFPASGSGNPFSSPDFLKTKNMNPQGWLLVQVYIPTSLTVYKSTITSNQDYADAKLIIQSMHY